MAVCTFDLSSLPAALHLRRATVDDRIRLFWIEKDGISGLTTIEAISSKGTAQTHKIEAGCTCFSRSEIKVIVNDC